MSASRIPVSPADLSAGDAEQTQAALVRLRDWANACAGHCADISRASASRHPDVAALAGRLSVQLDALGDLLGEAADACETGGGR